MLGGDHEFAFTGLSALCSRLFGISASFGAGSSVALLIRNPATSIRNLMMAEVGSGNCDLGAPYLFPFFVLHDYECSFGFAMFLLRRLSNLSRKESVYSSLENFAQ